MQVIDSSTHKIIKSTTYNSVFRKCDGYTITFGRTPQEDPVGHCPGGPVLADIEIASACEDDIVRATPRHVVANQGCCGKACKAFCYKKSTSDKTLYMSLDLLKEILDKFPKTLCQVAYGVCSVNHPIIFEILEETRRRDIVPNLTISGDDDITPQIASQLASLCGAVAVSVNCGNKDRAFNIIKLLSQDYGMSQINIHAVISEETASFVKSLCDDMKNDTRLSKCNCVVLLSFKNKAEVKSFTPVTQSTYSDVISYYLKNNCPVGADSCAGCAFQNAIKGMPDEARLSSCITNCESLLESIYVNVFGEVFACSFIENRGMWKEGLSILEYDSVEDIWNSEQTQKWRKLLLKNGRGCPEYKIGV